MILCLALLASLFRLGPPPTLPVRLEVVAKGLREPLDLRYDPGRPGILYIVEKGGRILALHEGKVDAKPFLDISGQVSRGSEQGLLGLAFHPKGDGRFYINYTDLQGDTRVVERTPRGFSRELLKVVQPYSNHNGGNLMFGPDGKLYVGTGDGGAGGDPHGHAQNPVSHLGKMLRIDVDAQPLKVDVVQTGLRNPWRYSFDRKTGALYIADVGQDRYEEINVVAQVANQNFGWNIREGMTCFRYKECEAFVLPVVEYTHREGCSVTGGFVYRGKALPALDGAYFYADYCTGLLRSFRWKEGRATDHWDWRPVLDPQRKLAKVSSFGEDAEGELYLLSLDGVIYKLK